MKATQLIQELPNIEKLTEVERLAGRDQRRKQELVLTRLPGISPMSRMFTFELIKRAD